MRKHEFVKNTGTKHVFNYSFLRRTIKTKQLIIKLIYYLASRTYLCAYSIYVEGVYKIKQKKSFEISHELSIVVSDIKLYL